MIHFETNSFGKVAIQFRHNMPKVELANSNNNLAAMVKNLKFTQGTTECRIAIEGWEVDAFGISYVHPYDQYKKETGREMSLKRAIEQLHLTESQEREILAGYYSR